MKIINEDKEFLENKENSEINSKSKINYNSSYYHYLISGE